MLVRVLVMPVVPVRASSCQSCQSCLVVPVVPVRVLAVLVRLGVRNGQLQIYSPQLEEGSQVIAVRCDTMNDKDPPRAQLGGRAKLLEQKLEEASVAK